MDCREICKRGDYLMTYQDQLIKDLVNELEKSIERNLASPCIYNAQKVAEAKHKLMEFIHAK